jgi:REP element-mobilizing transposase RayT
MELSDGTYHITARGNRRQLIFGDDGDRRFFLALLARITREYEWSLHSYCLLDTHYHLVLETTRTRLSAGMKRLNGTYAQTFNARHGFVGHLFQGRFYSGLIEGEGHLLEVIRYVAANPVKAGLCDEASAWQWSSYASLIGQRRREPFVANERVLALFSEDPSRARHSIRRFLTDR